MVAVPDFDWQALSKEFVESLGLEFNPLTTQIESHDWQAELYQAITHFNRIAHNLTTDIWSYISIGYFKQTPVKGATGSSTMPHKVNPIRFENAEANLEISNAILDSLSQTLVTSRLQRDLSDSSSQRNIGVGFGHSLVALDNILKGLAELSVADSVMAADLADNWEVLAEAIQTVIRAEVISGKSKIKDPYELLKELTRGKRLTREDLADFILKLDISKPARQRLLGLSPKDYIGLASKLAQSI
jgi:adenylosuccinate lyase